MMRFLAVAATVVALASTTTASAVSPSEIEGRWVSEGGYAIFDASLCGDGTQLCGTLVSLSEDTEAPMLEGLVGQQVVSNARSIGEGKWEWMPFFDPNAAKATFTLTAPNTIEAEGCMFGSCRSIRFEKADSPA